MAESTRARERGTERRNGSADDAGHARERNGRRTSAADAVALAKEQLLELTGRPCESVSSVSRQQDGWLMTLEVVELERVPRTTDVLASYRVQLDDDGNLIGYQRVSRYYRNQASEE